MPTSVEPILFDTSAALALSNKDHPLHAAIRQASAGYPRGLSGHATFELSSVLTRLPRPQRLAVTDAHALIVHNFPERRFLPAEETDALLVEFAAKGVTGGQVYDGLVGACARHHDLVLLTCDRRAESTYRALGVRYRLATTE